MQVAAVILQSEGVQSLPSEFYRGAGTPFPAILAIGFPVSMPTKGIQLPKISKDDKEAIMGYKTECARKLGTGKRPALLG